LTAFFGEELSTPSLGITYYQAAAKTLSHADTFNSLSRDHELFGCLYSVKSVDAFNSLSRDHEDDVEKAVKAAAQKFFQLPLSGSRKP